MKLRFVGEENEKYDFFLIYFLRNSLKVYNDNKFCGLTTRHVIFNRDTMAENLGKRPSKGILKTSSSFDSHEAPR